MNEIRKFIEWLSFHPTPDEITRALVLDYLAPAQACCSRIGILNSDDSLTFVGEYGFEDGKKGKTFTGGEWRTWGHDAADIALGLNPNHWSEDKKLIMFPLRHRGAVQGHIVVRFSQPIKDTKQVEELVLNFAVPISLYLSLKQDGVRSAPLSSHREEGGADQLSVRQISILRGMVEGKTNHELATELGFSVSTIRHETMRIYQALNVSDRKEAAKKALVLSLL
jgi:DNA-binding CsgD family transcriptional regulator